MRCEIVAVGTELLLGQIVDTNSTWIGQQLAEAGIDCLYQTRVGEHGARLSGGQRQRIALARAILRDPAIVILDEATSAVDPESKRLIQQALAEFCARRTTLVVTHRLETLQWVDRVVVLEGGRIEAVGTPEEIGYRSQVFARLSAPQFRKTA